MAITLGVHTKAESHNAPSLTSAGITTQASGSLFVAVNVGQGTVGISDSNSNTWVLGASQNFNGTNGITHFWSVQNATGGGGNTFTGTQTGGAGPQFLIAEFLGCALSGGPNVSNFAELSGSVAAVTGPSVTTTVAGCLIVTVMVGDNFPALVTPSSANGAVTDAFATNGNGIAGALSWFVAGAAGSYNDTLTFSGQTAYDFACYTFAFAPAAGSGSITAATGAFTLTGEPVTFSSSQTLAAAFGSFALTGEAATLTQGGGSAVTLFASAGAFDLTGAPATQDLQTDMTAGLFTLIGVPANLPGSQTTTGGPGLFRRRHHKFVQGH